MVQPILLLVIVGVIGFIGSVPIHTNSSLSTKRDGEFYDQRQTGEYNIRVNLKDIQIIALLGGDYNDDNFEYDYEIPSDYTDFPITTSTTTMPNSTSTSTSSSPLNTSVLNTVTSAVTIKTKPLTTTNSPKTTTKTKLTTSILNSSTSTKPTSSISTKSTPSTTTNKPSSITTSTSSSDSTTSKPSNKTLTYSYQTGLTGDRIPVIVLQQNQNNDGASKAAMITSHVTIVPEDDVNEEITERVEVLGEIHYKKCPNGLVRDKNGICRKLKRPPLFDISRFTSSLVSKFRRQDAVTSAGRKTTVTGNS